MSMRKRLARAIHKCGSNDPETVAEYLLKKGWTDQPATVITAISSPVPRVTLSPGLVVTLPDSLQTAARAMDRPKVVRIP